LTVPFKTTAQEWYAPVDIAIGRLSKGTGAALALFVEVLSPSWPSPLKPQHFTVSSNINAHVCWNPQEMEVTPFSDEAEAVTAAKESAFPFPS
jgi:hypothetical protein